uniref:uncharacterized protein LOC114600428 n=1 Tax=Podarcis muralis TaxID=64176 RepID=UPI0010A049CD|nr:uncharacterized protein LOC114600428 [Podarcis muralis]
MQLYLYCEPFSSKHPLASQQNLTSCPKTWRNLPQICGRRCKKNGPRHMLRGTSPAPEKGPGQGRCYREAVAQGTGCRGSSYRSAWVMSYKYLGKYVPGSRCHYTKDPALGSHKLNCRSTIGKTSPDDRSHHAEAFPKCPMYFPSYISEYLRLIPRGEMPWCKNGSPALTLGGLVLADTDVDEGVHSASLCRDTNGMFLCNISTHNCLYNDGCIIIIIIQSIPKIFFVLLRDEKQHSRYPWVCRLDKHNAKRMEGEDENKK